MKEGGGADHISVGIRMRRKIVPIPSKYLYMVPPGMKYVTLNSSDNFVSYNIIKFCDNVVYYLIHEKECFIIFKTGGAAERFRYDKTRLFECIK